ncbi:hypothetical protein CKO40_10155 [Halochromatium glycolicum]|uniref:Uncharacterized protein n=1 Tax=Halochromatium glycolicum TaxID=85075 RepID=A0AAJ0U421_9GAMM|nr:hypothetical protein [Halochromatium glycolicum]
MDSAHQPAQQPGVTSGASESVTVFDGVLTTVIPSDRCTSSMFHVEHLALRRRVISRQRLSRNEVMIIRA